MILILRLVVGWDPGLSVDRDLTLRPAKHDALTH